MIIRTLAVLRKLASIKVRWNIRFVAGIPKRNSIPRMLSNAKYQDWEICYYNQIGEFCRFLWREFACIHNPKYPKSHMSHLTEKRADRRREVKRSPKVPVALWSGIEISEWILCCAILLLILALPWYYGCVQWKSQYILAWVGVVFSCSMAVHCIVSMVSKSRDLSIPWLTWLFFFLGAMAFLQSSPIFSWQGNEIAPRSVQLQRWALGLSDAPSSMQKTLYTTSNQPDRDGTDLISKVPCDLKNVPDAERKLAWSIEPLHTRGAAVSLMLCGLFVWMGRAVFSNASKQLWLFGTLTLIGMLIACVGVQGAISYQSLNFLGLRSGSSFATFVSKNSAGGFYNICIAGSLGLLGWTLLNTQRSSKDTRYRFPDTSYIAKARGFAEDSLADLNTAQISAMLCLIGIVAALLISLCRGAAVSALGAIVISAFIANSRNGSRGNWAVAVAVATTIVASLVAFQVDEKAYARLGSLSEIDLEEELQAGRAYIWSVAWKAMTFYGWLGSGLGTFHFAYLPFQEPSSIGWYYHAESLYAQCGVELGYLGVTALAVAIVVLVAGLQRPPAKENWRLAFPSKLAGAYLVFSQAFHSFVDFAIILPALFVPACVLIGSVQGTLQNAQIAPVRKRGRSDSSRTDPPVMPKSIPWVRNGLLGIMVAAGSGYAIASSIDSVRSLSVSEAMLDWTKAEEKKPLEDQTSERVIEMAKIWASDNASLKQNPHAMGAFANSLLFDYRMKNFDYRMKQLIASKQTVPWSQVWRDTSPVFLQLALDREKNPMKREQIIKSVGGQNAIDLLGKSANWYALGQTKSPLDWRLLWGRCLTNTECDQNEIAKLLPASLVLAKHNAQQLLATTVLFRDQFDQKQHERILTQAMKSNPSVSVNSAKLLAMEREDNTVSIEIFPQKYDVLETIAKVIFTKELFPKTNRQLWERARELVAKAPVTASRRHLWLADSSSALGDVKGEITHLRAAVLAEPNSIMLHCRLANRLLDIKDVNGAKAVLEKLKRQDPENSEVKALADRILKYKD